MLLIDEAIENRITRINEFLPVFLSVLLQALQNHNERRKKIRSRREIRLSYHHQQDSNYAKEKQIQLNCVVLQTTYTDFK